MIKRLTSSALKNQDLGLFILRIASGLLMMGHGWGKLSRFSEIAPEFYSFIGLGGPVSLGLTVFAEFFCAILIAVGLFTRAATVPLIVTMLVAVLIIHGSDPLEDKEMAMLYLAPYLAILLMGPGRYSLDHVISNGRKTNQGTRS